MFAQREHEATLCPWLWCTRAYTVTVVVQFRNSYRQLLHIRHSQRPSDPHRPLPWVMEEIELVCLQHYSPLSSHRL